MRVQLHRGEWILSDQIGGGGFGRVVKARSDNGETAAAKLVPKEPGAERELLLADVNGARNVVPILDSGDTDTDWVLIMPRAEKSLRQHLEQLDAPSDVASAVAILGDIAATLTDLDGSVVHRDLKPENVLYLDGHWCLADFGIARYAEATTSPDTRKFALSPLYAAPERWKGERATTATDIYSLGVIAYELLSGEVPFTGKDMPELRGEHLAAPVPHLTSAPAVLAALVEECLYKAPQARPTAANLVQRLARAAERTPSTGLAALQEANRAEAIRRGESTRLETLAKSEEERRTGLLDAATSSWSRIAETLKYALTSAAPAATIMTTRNAGWEIRLGTAVLTVVGPRRTAQSPWGSWNPPAFDVIAHASINIRIPADRHQYEGREHSLWFCDAAPKGEGSYQWFETAFMVSPMIPERGRQDPFGLDPSEEAAKALSRVVAERQLAWPFTALTIGDLDEFISRWAQWFAAAAENQLSHPSSMPERRPEGSYRQT